MLIRICGPKWNEVTGGWIKLHDDNLHILYCSPNIIIKDGVAGHTAPVLKVRHLYKILVRNSEAKRQLGTRHGG
jgi:hypothetical protein